MEAGNVLNRLDHGLVQSDGAHLLEACLVIGQAKDPEEAAEAVSGVGPHEPVVEDGRVNRFGYFHLTFNFIF